MRKVNGKFDLMIWLAYKIAGYLKSHTLENVRQGECDWCTKPAVTGFKVNSDAFYLCEIHKAEN